MADDVEEFIHEHGLSLPILMGHSMFVFALCLQNRDQLNMTKYAKGAPK